MYNTAATYSLKGDADEAFRWLGRLKQGGKFNLSDIGVDADLTTLKDDPRFVKLYPTPAEYADPFVERIGYLS